MKTKGMFLFHGGEAFESEGSGRFAKEILRVGKWVHPLTGRDVVFDEKRVEKLAKNAELWLKNGNTIPFPDGHRLDALSNLGFWPGPVMKIGSKLVGVVEPKSAEALEGVKSGTINGVSAYIEKNVTDPKGNEYDEVITHICATNYPVVTESKDFVALSKDAGAKGVELWIPEALDSADGECTDPMDLHAAHRAMAGEVEEASSDFASKLKKKGPDHEDTKKAAGALRDATARLANHASLMHKHVQNMTTDYPYHPTAMDQGKKLTLDEALAKLSSGPGNPSAIEKALEDLAKPKTK